MKPMRLLIALFAIGSLCGLAIIAQEGAPAGTQMADAAEKFLASLTPEQQKQASFDFDDAHRLGWFFTPQQDKEKRSTRKGVRMEDLNEKQQENALALLKAGTSKKGFEQATTIMSLEGILKEFEGPKGAMVRNPKWYFVSIFGKPSKTGKWGWRLEGHHLSVSFTLDRGQVESPTPFFFGANPGLVKSGPKKGLRTLPEVEDLPQALAKSFTDDQRKVAHQGDKHFPEIAENTPAEKIGSAVGLPYSKMTEAQQKILSNLIEAYANRMPSAVAEAELKAAKDAGFDKIYFAYTGEASPDKAYTYRVHGPTFVIQFLNIQADGEKNPNNHIHSVWRKLPADFALKTK